MSEQAIEITQKPHSNKIYFLLPKRPAFNFLSAFADEQVFFDVNTKQ